MDKRVILVEDEECGEEFKVLLPSFGFDVLLYRGGSAAIHDVVDGLDYDIGLVDRSLPDCDGEKVIWHLKRTNPNKPVLSMSGYDKPARYADGHITKMVSVESLARSLSYYLDTRGREEKRVG